MTTFSTARYIARQDERAPVLLAGEQAGVGVAAGRAVTGALPTEFKRTTFLPGQTSRGGRGLVMAASFGEQLRLAREARGITLRQISDQTRISMRYLEAIETDDYKRLPGGIFNRSFIKAYAKQIGFDEKEAIEGYLRTAREQGESDEVATTPYKSHVYTDGGARSPLITLLLTVLVLAILSLGVYAVYHYWYRQRDAARNQQPNSTQGAQPVNPTAQPSASPTPTLPANSFHIEIAARNKDVWVCPKIDDSKKCKGIILKPGNPPEKFDPAERLTISYAPVNAEALEVTINGRQVKVPTDKAEMVIAKEDYEQK